MIASTVLRMEKNNKRKYKKKRNQSKRIKDKKKDPGKNNRN
jgi:hypothetical protein